MSLYNRQSGITRFEAIALLFLFGFPSYLGMSLLFSSGQSGVPNESLIRGAISESGDSVRIYGTPIGYSSVSREIEGIYAISSMENPYALGFLLISVTPIVGDLSIDTNRMKITLARAGDEIPVSRSRDVALNPGNWTIAKKYNMIPMHSADEDDILEGGEIFDLLISLPESFTPYEKFIFILSPEHGMPWKQEMTVPPVTSPIVKFGWT